eukprot:scaffold18758_cov31-Tisochrysis_lutea.AAC.4
MQGTASVGRGQFEPYGAASRCMKEVAGGDNHGPRPYSLAHTLPSPSRQISYSQSSTRATPRRRTGSASLACAAGCERLGASSHGRSRGSSQRQAACRGRRAHTSTAQAADPRVRPLPPS